MTADDYVTLEQSEENEILCRERDRCCAVTDNLPASITVEAYSDMSGAIVDDDEIGK